MIPLLVVRVWNIGLWSTPYLVFLELIIFARLDIRKRIGLRAQSRRASSIIVSRSILVSSKVISGPPFAIRCLQFTIKFNSEPPSTSIIWCCGPAAEGGTCNCGSGSGTFSVQSGEAQTIIGSFGSSQTTLINFLSRQTSSSKTEQSQKTNSQSTTTAPSPTSSANKSIHSTTTVSPLSTRSSSSKESSHNTKLKASLGTVSSVLGLGAIIAGYFLWRRKRAPNAHTTGYDDNPPPESPYQATNQPPPGQDPYEPQPINPLQGGEPSVIAPDQDEHRYPPAVTPSPRPRGGLGPYSRVFADQS